MIRVLKQIISNPNAALLNQSLRFVFSGGLATATHWLLMIVMLKVGTAAATATALGALVGAVVNYVLQREVTFKSKRGHRSALLRYLSVCALLWFANLIVFLILYHTVLPAPMYAQAITTGVVAFLSYILYKRVVFNDRDFQADH